MMDVKTGAILFILGIVFSSGRAGEIRQIEIEGRAQFVVKTGGATWHYDRAGGGFSRLIDHDGKDWIGFHKEPLSKYPASAAAGYRGIPNCVFRGPDKGAGHPGFDKCVSEVVAPNRIRTTSKSGKWAWTWTFTESTARFRMEKEDPEHAWWFLYEGTVGGRFKPDQQYWGTNLGGPKSRVFASKNQHFANWRWAYFGDRNSARVLFVLQHQADELSDTIWHLASGSRGDESADGMIVFGMGRAPKAKPVLKGAGLEFTVGLIEAAVKTSKEHDAVASTIEAQLK
ncbi:MAG: hypothetical protein ACI9VS_000245 [Candidatus Binatia bacterium]|jgi:hypothetical protein